MIMFYKISFVSEDWEVDAEWIGFLITGGWLVLLPAVLIGLLLGDEIPWRRVSRLERLASTPPCRLQWPPARR
jgi:hypothetical protein